MNTTKRIISFLILVFAMLTITTISSFAAEDTRIEVSEFIATSDFVEPAYNSTVKTAYKFTFTTGAQAQAYSRMSGWHKWNEEISNWERYSATRFSTGKYRYFVQIRIDSDSGCGTTHKLAKTATVIVDGAEWEYSDNPTVESDYSYTYIYSPEFDVKKIIKKVEITDLTMPIIGENPDYDISVPSGMGYYVSQYEGKDYVDWYANRIMTEILPVNYKYNSSAEYIFATLIEAEEGCKFSSDVTVMVGDLSARVASNSGDSIIIMLENIKAVERIYTVTVSNATASKQQAKAGEIITLTANAPSVGKIFDKWLVSGATVANAASKTTSFTMPENDVTATATYKNCIHTFDNACDKDCNICKATRTPADHTGGTATCTEKAVCAECSVKYGELASHNYAAATCTAAKTCKSCGATSGKALGHKYSNTCDTSCNTCKATRKITHSYKSTTTKATLKKNGKQVTKCTVCGNVSKTTTVYYPKTIKLSYTSTTYNGKTKKPTVTVKDSKGKTLKKDTDYTVKYSSGRKNPGKYTVTVTFKGKYSGTKKLSFTINPKAVTLSKVTAGSKQLTASWKTVANITGYEVQASTSKKFTSKTTKKVTIKKAKTTKTTIKKLKKGKKYYVKVRAYKTVGKTKIYSAWSSVKTVKVK